MTEPTLHSHTASDGYVWRYRHYTADARPPAARVIYLHGIQSHGGWYEGSCRHLAAQGLEVYFPDRRGSGLNDRDRGDAPGFRRLLDDVAELVRELQAREPGRRTLLVAVSWGGKLVAALPRRHPGLVDAIALLCPGFCPKVGPGLAQRLRIVWSRLVSPRRLFPIPLSEPELFTATPRWLEFLRHDPLALHQATARFLVESVRLDGYLRRGRKDVRVPMLLMLAGRDRIIDNERTRALVDGFASARKDVIEYPDAHHTLEFEPDPTRFFADLSGWLLRQASGAA